MKIDELPWGALDETLLDEAGRQVRSVAKWSIRGSVLRGHFSGYAAP